MRRVCILVGLVASACCDGRADGPPVRIELLAADGSPVTDATLTCTLEGAPTTIDAAGVSRGFYSCGAGAGQYDVSLTWRGSVVEHGVVVVRNDGSSCHPIVGVFLHVTLDAPADAGVPTDH